MTIVGTTDTDGLPYAVIESALNQQTLFQSKTIVFLWHGQVASKSRKSKRLASLR